MTGSIALNPGWIQDGTYVAAPSLMLSYWHYLPVYYMNSQTGQCSSEFTALCLRDQLEGPAHRGHSSFTQTRENVTWTVEILCVVIYLFLTALGSILVMKTNFTESSKCNWIFVLISISVFQCYLMISIVRKVLQIKSISHNQKHSSYWKKDNRNTSPIYINGFSCPIETRQIKSKLYRMLTGSLHFQGGSLSGVVSSWAKPLFFAHAGISQAVHCLNWQLLKSALKFFLLVTTLIQSQWLLSLAHEELSQVSQEWLPQSEVFAGQTGTSKANSLSPPPQASTGSSVSASLICYIHFSCRSPFQNIY